MAISRRDVLKLALTGAVHPLLPVRGIVSQAYTAPGAADARFLLVFLRGGYDAANVVVPVASSFYYQARPTLAVPRPDAGNPDAAIALAGPADAVRWGLHPALRESLLPLWEKRQLAFVPFAGTEDLTRSHFETQDSLEAGLPVDGTGGRGRGSGFLNRLAGVLDGSGRPVSFTSGLPVVMTGAVQVPNVSLKGNGRPPLAPRQMDLIAGMYEGTRFEPLIAEGFELRKTVAEQAAQMASGGAAEMIAANRNALTARGFEVEARRMAGLMRDRFNLGFIDVGGWDTHVNQGAAQGQLANLLGNLGQGLAGFATEMGPLWDRTVVVVLSEFGRTFRENGTRGTDHGHGSVHWVLGGAVHGGRFAGREIDLTEKTLNQNRDLPVLTEYRAMLGGLFRRMYGLDQSRLATVFPGTSALDLDLL
jgi:uncharacterized protein (DUF1501 family)